MKNLALDALGKETEVNNRRTYFQFFKNMMDAYEDVRNLHLHYWFLIFTVTGFKGYFFNKKLKYFNFNFKNILKR